MLFDFLLIVVEAHHPNGADEHSAAAYAFDWTVWKRELMKINYIAISEINSVLKHEKQGVLWPSFLNLIVHVYKQIFHSNGNSLDVTIGRNFFDESALQDPSTCKRMRVTGGLPDLIDRLNDVTQFADMWPWYDSDEMNTRLEICIFNFWRISGFAFYINFF